MKPVKKILALILAGVMALALLTGCGKATSLNRTIAEGIAEGMAEYYKSELAQQGNKNNISVSYQVPELSRNIAPLFDETWITKDSSGDDALTEAAEQTLTNILSSYMSDSAVTFLAADVTDVKTPFVEGVNLLDSQIDFSGGNSSLLTSSITSIRSIRIAVVHKNVNSRTYALAVIIYEA